MMKVNDLQPLKIVEILKKHFPSIKGKNIGVLGLSFKKDTDDIRESRAIPVIKKLLQEKAIIKVYDPKAMDNFKKIFPQINYSNINNILNSDAILILTDWDEFRKLNYKGKLIIDGRRLEEAKQGIYEGICW